MWITIDNSVLSLANSALNMTPLLNTPTIGESFMVLGLEIYATSPEDLKKLSNPTWRR